MVQILSKSKTDKVHMLAQKVSANNFFNTQIYHRHNSRAREGGLSVGRRLEFLHNVWRRFGNETVSVRLKWSGKCRATKSGCRCRATLILG